MSFFFVLVCFCSLLFFFVTFCFCLVIFFSFFRLFMTSRSQQTNSDYHRVMRTILWCSIWNNKCSTSCSKSNSNTSWRKACSGNRISSQSRQNKAGKERSTGRVRVYYVFLTKETISKGILLDVKCIIVHVRLMKNDHTLIRVTLMSNKL